MNKFPEDVETAEKITGGDPNILSSEKFSPEEKPDISSLFGEKKIPKKKREDSNRRSDSTAISRRITHHRFLRQSDHEVRIREQSSNSGNIHSSSLYSCYVCDFACSRVNVIISHLKSHQFDDPSKKKSSYKTLSKARNKHLDVDSPKRKYVRKDKSSSGKSKGDVSVDHKKRKIGKSAEKIPKKKKLNAQEERKRIQEELLGDWLDDSDVDMQADFSQEESLDLSSSTITSPAFNSSITTSLEKASPIKNDSNLENKAEESALKEDSDDETFDLLRQSEKLLIETQKLSTILDDSASGTSRTKSFIEKLKSDRYKSSKSKDKADDSKKDKKTFEENDDKKSKFACFEFDEEDVPEPSTHVRKPSRFFLKKDIIKEFQKSEALKNEKEKHSGKFFSRDVTDQNPSEIDDIDMNKVRGESDEARKEETDVEMKDVDEVDKMEVLESQNNEVNSMCRKSKDETIKELFKPDQHKSQVEELEIVEIFEVEREDEAENVKKSISTIDTDIRSDINKACHKQIPDSESEKMVVKSTEKFPDLIVNEKMVTESEDESVNSFRPNEKLSNRMEDVDIDRNDTKYDNKSEKNVQSKFEEHREEAKFEGHQEEAKFEESKEKFQENLEEAMQEKFKCAEMAFEDTSENATPTIKKRRGRPKRIISVAAEVPIETTNNLASPPKVENTEKIENLKQLEDELKISESEKDLQTVKKRKQSKKLALRRASMEQKVKDESQSETEEKIVEAEKPKSKRGRKPKARTPSQERPIQSDILLSDPALDTDESQLENEKNILDSAKFQKEKLHVEAIALEEGKISEDIKPKFRRGRKPKILRVLSLEKPIELQSKLDGILGRRDSQSDIDEKSCDETPVEETLVEVTKSKSKKGRKSKHASTSSHDEDISVLPNEVLNSANVDMSSSEEIEAISDNESILKLEKRSRRKKFVELSKEVEQYVAEQNESQEPEIASQPMEDAQAESVSKTKPGKRGRRRKSTSEVIKEQTSNQKVPETIPETESEPMEEVQAESVLKNKPEKRIRGRKSTSEVVKEGTPDLQTQETVPETESEPMEEVQEEPISKPKPEKRGRGRKSTSEVIKEETPDVQIPDQIPENQSDVSETMEETQAELKKFEKRGRGRKSTAENIKEEMLEQIPKGESSAQKKSEEVLADEPKKPEKRGRGRKSTAEVIKESEAILESISEIESNLPESMEVLSDAKKPEKRGRRKKSSTESLMELTPDPQLSEQILEKVQEIENEVEAPQEAELELKTKEAKRIIRRRKKSGEIKEKALDQIPEDESESQGSNEMEVSNETIPPKRLGKRNKSTSLVPEILTEVPSPEEQIQVIESDLKEPVESEVPVEPKKRGRRKKSSTEVKEPIDEVTEPEQKIPEIENQLENELEIEIPESKPKSKLSRKKKIFEPVKEVQEEEEEEMPNVQNEAQELKPEKKRTGRRRKSEVKELIEEMQISQLQKDLEDPATTTMEMEQDLPIEGTISTMDVENDINLTVGVTETIGMGERFERTEVGTTTEIVETTDAVESTEVVETTSIVESTETIESTEITQPLENIKARDLVKTSEIQVHPKVDSSNDGVSRVEIKTFLEDKNVESKSSESNNTIVNNTEKSRSYAQNFDLEMLPPKKSQIKKFELSQMEFLESGMSNNKKSIDVKTVRKLDDMGNMELEIKCQGNTEVSRPLEEVLSGEVVSEPKDLKILDSLTEQVSAAVVVETMPREINQLSEMTTEKGFSTMDHKHMDEETSDKMEDKFAMIERKLEEMESVSPKTVREETSVNKSPMQTRYKGKFTPETGSRSKKDKDPFSLDSQVNATFQDVFIKTLQIDKDKKSSDDDESSHGKGKKQRKTLKKKSSDLNNTNLNPTSQIDTTERNVVISEVSNFQAHANISGITTMGNFEGVEVVVGQNMEVEQKMEEPIVQTNQFIPLTTEVKDASNETTNSMSLGLKFEETSLATPSPSSEILVPVKKREKPRIIENVALKEPMILKSKLLEKMSPKTLKHKLEGESSMKGDSRGSPRSKMMKMDTLTPGRTKNLSLSQKIQALKAEELVTATIVDSQNESSSPQTPQTITALSISEKCIQQSSQSLEDMDLDINNMPFVLSEDVLTPESIENMPVVISGVIPSEVKTPVAQVSVLPTPEITSFPASQITTIPSGHPTTSNQQPTTSSDSSPELTLLKKKSGTPAILKPKIKGKPTITSIKTIVPPLTGGVRSLKFQNPQAGKATSFIPQKGTPGKYVIVHSAGGQQVRCQQVPGKSGTPQKIALPSSKSPESVQIVQQDRKLMILSSQSVQPKIVPINIGKSGGKVQRIVTNKGQILTSVSPQTFATSKSVIASKGDANSPTTSKLSGQKIINPQGIISHKGVLTPIAGTINKSGIIGTLSPTILTKGGMFTTISGSPISGRPILSKNLVAKGNTILSSNVGSSKNILATVPQTIVSSKGTVLTPITGQQVKALAGKAPQKGSKLHYQTIQKKVPMSIIQKGQISTTPQKAGPLKITGGTVMYQTSSDQKSSPVHVKKGVRQIVQQGTPVLISSANESIQQTSVLSPANQRGKLITSSSYQKINMPKATGRQTRVHQKIIHKSQESLISQASSPQISPVARVAKSTIISKSSPSRQTQSPRPKNKVQRNILSAALNSIATTTSTLSPTTYSISLAVPPLEPISQDKKPKIEEVLEQQTSLEEPKPSELTNEVSEAKITSQPQIIAVPIEDSDGTQTFMLVTTDEQGQIQSLDNNTLMSLEGTLDNIVLQYDNGTVSTLHTSGSHANQPPMLETFPSSEIVQTTSQDILAAALANTDFQQEIGLPETVTSSVINTGLTQTSLINQTIMQSTIIPPTEPISSPSVLETSLTLNQPIMTPLEVPSSLSIQSQSSQASAATTIPTSLELPITITSPNISFIAGEAQIQIPGNSMPDIGETMETSTTEITQAETPVTQYLVIPNIEEGMTIGTQEIQGDDKNIPTVSYSVSIPENMILDSSQVQTTPSMPIIDDSFVEDVQYNASVETTVANEQNFTDVSVSEMLVSKASAVSDNVALQDVTVSSEMIVTSQENESQMSQENIMLAEESITTNNIQEESVVSEEVYTSQEVPVSTEEQILSQEVVEGSEGACDATSETSLEVQSTETCPYEITNSSEVQIEASEVEVEASHVQIEASEVEVEASHVQIEASEVDVEASHVQIEASEVDVEASHVQIEASEVEVEASDIVLEASHVEIETSQDQIETSQVQIKTSEDHIETSQVQIESSQDQIESSQDIETSDEIQTAQEIDAPQDQIQIYDQADTSDEAEAVGSLNEPIEKLQINDTQSLENEKSATSNKENSEVLPSESLEHVDENMEIEEVQNVHYNLESSRISQADELSSQVEEDHIMRHDSRINFEDTVTETSQEAPSQSYGQFDSSMASDTREVPSQSAKSENSREPSQSMGYEPMETDEIVVSGEFH